jgi:hypothetical protein
MSTSERLGLAAFGIFLTCMGVWWTVIVLRDGSIELPRSTRIVRRATNPREYWSIFVIFAAMFVFVVADCFWSVITGR